MNSETLTPDQLALWRVIHPSGFDPQGRPEQERIGGFIAACSLDGYGTPSEADVREQIEADRREGE